VTTERRVGPTVAILPLRRLDDAKGRLGRALTTDERARLALGLLRRAVTALLEGGVERVLIITLDKRLATLGLDPRVEVDDQPVSYPGLNGAIRHGQEWAVETGAASLLVVLPDLPLVGPEDIRAIVSAARGGRNVLAADRAGRGTNALLLSPPDAISTEFGEESATLHRAALRKTGLPFLEIERPGLALDLDTPDDLVALAALGHDWRAALASVC
jgi:2-phospho-L-lactate guanylyltransferase